ncbi:protein kinase domain-containing protein [Candidatus Uabimicrobium amorphum]|uniref:non-specific serine/threonine protein kinase n=1 Tax=Uabimicrobium amorphum TaxID=2596890 RepID=A0A5S9IP04_UABAM|nr:SUMF1/EgtB/PvdO family nonheme iron enzyme [Candidatus Uabimicrobium amorphum]BBM85399.1 serine/threonine protein kinase [Candidatus Uabimicrobium amorphum]
MPKVKDLSILMTRKDLANEDLSQLKFSPGFIIADRYECIELIGAGGMGAVYLVKDHILDNELIALKVLLPKFLGDEEAKKRFRKEVAISRKIFHQNVLRTYDLGTFESLDFFTMEYVQGQNLREWMKEQHTKGDIPLEQIADILVNVLEGLECAHKLTVHCDIKPDNILLCKSAPYYQVKICDFGISRIQNNTQLTYTSRIMGTYNYIAPEIQENGKIDRRIDLYSVGVICYEMLTEKMPIGRFSLPRELRPDLPEAIDTFIEKALAYEPENRFQNAEEMSEALQDFVSPNKRSAKRMKKDAQRQQQEQEKELTELKEKLDSRGKKLSELVVRQQNLQELLEQREQELAQKQTQLEQKVAIIEKQKKDLERKNKQVQEKQIALEDVEKELKHRKQQMEKNFRAKEQDFRKKLEAQRVQFEKEKSAFERHRQQVIEETDKIALHKKKEVSLFETAKLSFKSIATKRRTKAPFATTLWNECWQEQHEYFNFTHSSWKSLAVAKQKRYAQQYQRWYAQQHGYATEQIFVAGEIRVAMMLVPPGIFFMGGEEHDNEKPTHKVTIDRPFWMAKYPITQHQWYSVTGNKPWQGKKYGEEFPGSAASYISWKKIQEEFFAVIGKEFRFPSEAQWEYACRAGTTTNYYWGEDKSKIGEYAWYSANKKKNTPHLVGQKKPNMWGLSDMIGNVWEWCGDCWSENYHKTPVDGSSLKTESSTRSRRGGSYWSFAQDCRSACRTSNRADNCWDDLGFRILRKIK